MVTDVVERVEEDAQRRGREAPRPRAKLIVMVIVRVEVMEFVCGYLWLTVMVTMLVVDDSLQYDVQRLTNDVRGDEGYS